MCFAGVIISLIMKIQEMTTILYERLFSKSIFLTINFIFKYNLLFLSLFKKACGENKGNSVWLYLTRVTLPEDRYVTGQLRNLA